MKASHVAWTLTGLLFAAGMIMPAYSAFVGPLLFMASLGLPFLVHRRYGAGESWLAMVSGGLAMCVILLVAWNAHVGCPVKGGTVEIAKGKAPVACREIRASYLTFGTFFGVIALTGALLPWYRRRGGFDIDDEASDHGPASVTQ